MSKDSFLQRSLFENLPGSRLNKVKNRLTFLWQETRKEWTQLGAAEWKPS